MTSLAAKLTSALELEKRAHQQLVNIGEELKTVYSAGDEPDNDEVLRLRQAYQALQNAAHAVMAAAQQELVLMPRKKRLPRRAATMVGSALN